MENYGCRQTKQHFFEANYELLEIQIVSRPSF